MKIVYDSFGGRFSDSPRAVFEALYGTTGRHEHTWIADDAHRGGFPDGVNIVAAGGADAVAALEDADLVIANTHVELDWAKKPGARYLQTWHGTPLKRIHHDVLWAPEGRLAYLDLDVARWDLLLSPNHWSTPVLQKAFAYDGEVAETGYPRNDVLVGERGERVRRQVRADLGIADGVTAVLYAPTWRDQATLLDPAAEVPLGLDVAGAAAALGEDYCILQRLHYFNTSRRPAATGPNVHDVSFHPDIAELYLAADVMITDYSSTMFDFAVTGKPIVFHAWDLAEYGGTTRGFYLDLEEVAPGPVLATQDEVVDALRHLDVVAERHRDAYARFQQTFCHLEDGHATERVLDLLELR
ncbi:CDP-glycerol glycerophosphotransferase family protein [Jatrophihabitans sp. YIM 134969]